MLRTLTKYFFKAIRLILGLMLVGQGFIIALYLSNQENPFQQIAQKQIHQKLSAYNLTFQSSKITVGLNGCLDIREPRIFYQNSKQPILIADHFHVEANPFQLLLGNLSLTELALHDATLYCPAVFSQTGLNQELIHNLHASIKLKGKSHKIDYFNFNLDNLTVTIQGSLSSEFTQAGSVSGKISPRTLFLAFQTALTQKKNLSRFDDPILSINLIPTPKNTIIDAVLHAQQFQCQDLEIGSHYVHFQLAHSEGKISPHKPLFVRINDFKYKDKFLAGPSFFRTNLPSELSGSVLVPKKVSAIFTDPHFGRFHADTFSYNGPTNFDKLTQASFAMVNDKEWLRGNAEINLKEKALNLKAKGAIHPQSLQPVLSEKVNKVLEPLIFKKEPLVHAELKLANNFSFQNLEIQLNGTQTKYEHIDFKHFFANATITPSNLSIKYAHAHNKTNTLKGSYYHNLDSSDYRFLVSGNIAPQLLNPWMSSGWTSFWNNVEFHGPNPYGDGDIKGNWKDSQESQSFIYTTAENLSYMQTPLKKVDLNLFITPKITRLYNIEASTIEDEKLTGMLELSYANSKKHSLERIYVDANSSFPIPYLANFTNSEVIRELANPIECSTSPYLQILGASYPEHTSNDIFLIHFDTPDPVNYKNIPFDRLQTRIHYTPQITHLDNIQLGFADGSGFAEATITKRKENLLLAVKLNVDNANPRKATAKIKSLGHEEDEFSIPSEESSFFSNDSGLAHIDLQAVGTLGDLTSYTGSGKIEITQGNLGKVHLFGILSRLLDTTPLALGTFKLTNVSAPFDIQHNHIYFPDLNIYGPTANIGAHGNYTISSNKLDFTMNIAPLGKMKIPLISHAFLLFSPIAQSFQVQLAGTLEEPVWHVNITPFGLFKKKSSTAAIDPKNQKR